MAEHSTHNRGKYAKKPGGLKKNKVTDGAGMYYKFTTLDDDSSGSEDIPMSPRDYVDQILKECEIDTTPIDVRPGVPEPDFTQFDFLRELDGHPPSTKFNESRFSTDFDDDFRLSDIEDNYHNEAVGTLESPLDNPDSGYIDFLSSPADSNSGLSGELSERPGNDVISGFDRQRPMSAEIPDTRSPVEDAQAKSRSFPSVRFTKFKNDFSKLDEDNYFDDDVPVSPSTDTGDLDLGLATDTWKQCGSSSKSNHDHTLLAMDLDVETEVESMLCTDRDRRSPDIADTNPIILDQTDLALTWQKRRRKILLSVGIVAGVFGLMALAAITYLVIRFLTEAGS